MKKSILTCIVVGFLSLSSVIHAQAPIPNGDFEQWANVDEPVGWLVDILTPYTPIAQTSDSHGGTYAYEGTVIGSSTAGFQWPPVMVSGQGSVGAYYNDSARGFPYTDRPNSITGYYKFNPVGGDTMVVLCSFQKNSNRIGGGEFVALNAVSSYTSFSGPISWLTNDAPDTAIVTIEIIPTSDTGTPNLGSTMTIDDLAFSNQTVSAVSPSETLSFDLDQNYPNPLAGDITTTIAYSLDEPGFASIVVYDINGRVVATPVYEMLSGGNHIAQVDCSRLAAGVYSYRLTCGTHSATRTMQVLR